jgi:hypothetical protein
LVPSEELLEKRRKRYAAALARNQAAAARAARSAAATRAAPAGQKPEGYELFDLLLEDDLADLDPELQQLYTDLQQQQQQPAVTAMDWVLGEYADAAAGSHSFLTLDEEGGYMDESSAVGGWGSTPSSSSSSSATSGSSGSRQVAGSGAADGAADGADTAGAGDNIPQYMPSEFSRRDLQDLIQQYSWNVGQHPLLLEAALAAGLYPNYAFANLNHKLRGVLQKADKAHDPVEVGCAITTKLDTLQACPT